MPLPTTVSPAGPDGVYTGPLFDTHLHLWAAQRNLGSADAICRHLEENQVFWAIGFYSFPPDPNTSRERRALRIADGARNRIVPLIRPNEDLFRLGGYKDSLLLGYLEPNGVFHGVGEIGMYKPIYQDLTFESPQMQTAFRVVDGMKGVVMIHPSGQPSGRKMNLAEIEPSIRRYPDINFLFHGHSELFDLLSPLMSKYPNVYFTWDRPTIFFRQEDSTEAFIAEVNRRGIDAIVDSALRSGLRRIQRHPKRVMWGTDRSDPWNFEGPTEELLVTIARRFIARLPVEIQEDYAFRNAWRVFGGYLSVDP